MNRTDRLYALAGELRLAGERGRTAAALADQFEVSTRTIKRDVTTLQVAGLPIWSMPGPGGGYRFLESAEPDVDLRLTAGEATAVAIALRVRTDLPFAPEARTALSKILAALSVEEHEDVDRLLGRIWTTDSGERGAVESAIEQAIHGQRVLVIDYRDREGNASRREVDPLQLAAIAGRWYLFAYCRLREDGRRFRLDRISAAHLTHRPASDHDPVELFGEPPPDARSLSHG